MKGSTDENKSDSTKCVDEQLKFLQWCENALNECLAIKEEFVKLLSDVRSLQDEVAQVTKKMQTNDSKHDEAIAQIRLLVSNKHDEVIAALDKHDVALAETNNLIKTITPWVEWANPIVEKSIKWRNRLALFGAGALVWLFVSMINSKLSPAALIEFIKFLFTQAG